MGAGEGVSFGVGVVVGDTVEFGVRVRPHRSPRVARFTGVMVGVRAALSISVGVRVENADMTRTDPPQVALGSRQ